MTRAAAAEVARLAVSRTRASEIAKRDDFPAPVATVGARPIWLWADIEAWRAAPRQPGRPRQPDDTRTTP